MARLFPRMLTRMLPCVAALAGIALLGAIGPALAPSSATAQQPPSPTVGEPAVPPPSDTGNGDECFGLTFGRWEPALDPRTAGHPVIAADSAPRRAPNGRDWAARLESGRDTTIILFPSWWPAGVAVRFPEGRAAGSDTTHGTATALVADGRVQPPTTRVRLWSVACERGSAPVAAR